MPEETGGGFLDRLSEMFLKPKKEVEDPSGATAPVTLQVLEDIQHYADDQERLIGLAAAPLAAVIAILAVGTELAHDTKRLSTGKVNKNYASPGVLHLLLITLLALAVVMLISAWFRKRMPLGGAAALFGLSVFNLHLWEFGFPFILIGAWYLVHAYRANQNLKKARGEPNRWDRSAGGTDPGGPARPSKRYTPPKPKRRRPELPKGDA